MKARIGTMQEVGIDVMASLMITSVIADVLWHAMGVLAYIVR